MTIQHFARARSREGTRRERLIELAQTYRSLWNILATQERSREDVIDHSSVFPYPKDAIALHSARVRATEESMEKVKNEFLSVLHEPTS